MNLKRGFTRFIIITTWIVVLLLVMIAALRLLAYDILWPLTLFNMLTMYIYIPAWFLLMISILLRNRTLTIANLVIVIFHVGVVMNDGGLVHHRHKSPQSSSTKKPVLKLRIMTANALMINEKTNELMDEIRQSKPDVLFLQEFSLHWLADLRRAGIDLMYPYSTYLTREDSFGTAIFSSNPTFKGEIWYIDGLPMSRGSMTLESFVIKVYNIHTVPPKNREYWNRWNDQLRKLYDEVSSKSEATLMAGDFNLTIHTRWYKLLTTLLRGAHEDCGRPFAMTWPNGMFPLPDIRLDHILVSSEFFCAAIKEGKGIGSDHKPIIADFELFP